MAYKFSAAERRLQAELLREQRQNRYAAYRQKKPLTTAPKKKNKSGLAVAGATAADVGGNVLIGLGKGIEGIYDFGAGLVGAVGGLFSDDFEDSVKQHVAKDFTNELYGNALQEATEASALNDTKFGRIVEGVAQGVGQLLPTVAISVATAGLGTAAGLTAQAAAKAGQVAAMGSTMISAAGTATESAFNDGAEYGKGLTYGATMGAVEGVTEKLTGGIPVFGDSIVKGGKVIAKEGAEQVAKTGLKRVAKDAAGEGVEEMISELADPAAKSIYKGKDALSEYGDAEYWQGVGEAGVVGALTSVAYGGTVGHITKTSGVYADTRSVMEDIDTQVSEMATLEEKGKLTPEMEVAATKRIRRDYEQLSGILKKTSDKTRAELMKNPQVAAVFESDGTLKASVASNLDARIQYAGEGGGSQLMSRGVYGRESEIGEMLAKEGTEIYSGELTEAESENLSRLRKAHTALSRKGLVGTDFVISKESPKFNAYLDGNTVVIGKDTLTDGTYLQKLVHEVEHFAEGTKEWHEFANFVWKNTNTKTVIDSLLKSDYGVTQADADGIENALKSGNLSKGQRTLVSEVVAHQSEALFGDEQTILKLTRTNRTLAEKILDRIKAFLEVFKAKTPEEKKVVRRMQQAERLFEAALERAGTKYAVREMMAAENAAVVLDGEGATRYNNTVPQFSTKRAKYISYDKLGAGNVAAIRQQLYELYRGVGNSVANSVAIENGNTVYIVDSGKENGNISFGVRRKKTVSNAALRAEFIRSTNYDAVSKGHVSDELSSKIGGELDGDSGRHLRRESGAELSADTAESADFQGGVSADDADRGRSGIKQYSRKSHESADKAQVSEEIESTPTSGEGVDKSVHNVKYSLKIKYTDGSVEELADAKNLTKEQIVSYLKQAKSGKLRWNSYIPVRKDTPQIIIDALRGIHENVVNRSLVMQVRKAQQAMAAENPGSRGGKRGNNVRKHALSPLELVEIMENLDKPSEIVYQTNRQDQNGNPIPNNIAVFVEYSVNAKEGVAVIEFDSFIDSESIGNEHGETKFHTVVTAFVPDTERNGVSFDYAEELLEKTDNISLMETNREQSTQGVIGKKRPNISSEMLSNTSIPQNGEMSTPDTQENFDKPQFSRKTGTFTHRDVDAMVSSIRSDILTFTLEDGAEIKGKILSRDGVDLSKWLYDTLNAADLKDKRALARQIAMQIFDVAMAEDGRPLSDMLDAAQADSVREDLALSVAALLGDKQAEVENRRINKQLDTMRKIVGEMQDVEKGRFYSATIYDGDTLRAIPGLLRSALKSSRVFTGSIRNTLVKVKDWYCAIDNAMLYKVTAETPIEKMADGQVVFDKDVAAMLEQLTAGTGNLTADELEMVVNIAKHFQKLSERYMRVFVDGKWLDAEKMAESMVDKAHRAKEDQNLIVHGITSGYMREFADPAALFRAMDGYDADGFFSTVHGWMREAAIGMQSDELHALSQYYEWHKEHKKWAKHLEKDIVTFRGHKMSLGQLLTLFCNLKTEKSKQGLADNGFKYTDADGTVHRIKGLIYEQTPDSKSSIKHKRKAVREACKSAELDILKTLTAEQREYVKLLERVLNTTCRKWKIDTDVLLKGFTRVRESGYYFPSAHNGIAKTVDTTFYEGDRVTHLSLNHDVVEGARGELVIENIDDVVLRHVHNMALYKNYAVVAENRSMLQNIDVGRVDGTGKRIKNVHQAVTIRSTMEEYGKRGIEMMKLLDKMSKDLQGSRRAGQDEQGFLRQLVESIRGNYARFQLGFNPKTMATQLSSVIASMHRLDIGCVIGGLKGMASKRTAALVDKYCPLAELRNFENSAALAAGVLEKTGKIGDVLMKGIGWMDRRVVCALFEGCQRQVQKDNGLALGTEENLIAAGKLLPTIILETQQNSLVTERSDAMRGGFLGRSFSMFTADSMKNMGRVLDSFGEWATLKRRLKNAGTDAERVRLQKELKRVHRQVIRSTSVLVAQAVYAALIAYLFKLLYDRDEEDVEGNLKQAGADFFGAMLGGLPVFRDIYSYFAEGYELDNFFISTINDVLVSTKNAFDVASDAMAGKDVTKQEVYGAVRKAIYAGGQVFGIPTRNAYNFVVGVTRRFLPEVGYTVDSLFVAKSYSADLERAIEAGDEHMAETIAGLMIDEKIGIEDEKMREVLRKLAGEGYSVLPRSVGDSVTLDGEEHTLNGKQQKRFRTVYGVAEEAVADMVRLKRFAEADAAVQAKAIQFIYSVYWDLALEDVLGKDLAEKNVLFAEAIDIEKLAIIIAMARSLEADKDKDGKAIAGSKKRKVEQLVASLKLTAAQKYMVMGYLGYTNKNGKAQVEGYISRLKLTKDEKTALLKYSGYAA